MLWTWLVFLGLLVVLLVLDLFVFHRRAHEPSLREAAAWSTVWIGLGLLGAALVGFRWGRQAGTEYLAGYLLELSLSVDNVFVFALLFSYFAVPGAYRHRVLFWGIFGAIVMRLSFVLAGAALLQRFHFTIYVFGAILLYSAWKIGWREKAAVDPARNPVLRWVRRRLPVSEGYHGARLWVRVGKRWHATPLFVVLVAIELTDVVFAVDSVPAVFGVTRDPFIAFSSNAMAVLGLRALYFLVIGTLQRFRYLDQGLAVLLGLVGLKMLLSDFYKVPVGVFLGVIALVLGVTVALSLWVERQGRAARREDSRPTA